MILGFHTLLQVHSLYFRNAKERLHRVNFRKWDAFLSHYFYQITLIPSLTKSILNLQVQIFSVLAPLLVRFKALLFRDFQYLTEFSKLVICCNPNDYVLIISSFVHTVWGYVRVLIPHSLIFNATVEPRACHVA
jgi:hypothetical protein